VLNSTVYKQLAQSFMLKIRSQFGQLRRFGVTISETLPHWQIMKEIQ